MGRFKFRLEKVLNVRETLEERAKLDWAAQERLAHEERCKQRVLEQQKEEIREFGYGQNDLHIRQEMYSYLEILDKRIEQQIFRVKQQEAVAEKAKEKYLLAQQETKKVLTLRDKQQVLFLKEELRKEQMVLDDMRSYLKK